MPKVARPAVATVKLTIDGRAVEGPKGMTVLQIARAHGIYIPHLCDYEWLTPFTGCRVCLVEIEGRRGLDTSCTIIASDGMVVLTSTPKVREMQLGVMEALLSEHPDRCLTCPREDRCPPDVICQRDNYVTDRCVLCPRNKQCELQRVVDFVGVRWNRLGEGRRPPKPERSNPFIDRNESYCIYCARCVRICDEVRGIFAFGLAYRGPHTRISVDFDRPLTSSPCNFCGACAIVCPTGALIKRDTVYGRIADSSVPSVCTHCSDGCSLYLNRRDGRIINVLPDVNAPHNEGQLCVKGQFAYDYMYSHDRLLRPMLRGANDALREAGWDEALQLAAAKLVEIKRKHGPDAVGVLVSCHCSNEDAYLAQKMARLALGTNNVDQPGRLWHGATVGALGQAFGTPAMTMPIADVALAGCVLVAGSATVESHEITALRVKKAVRNGAKLIVVDPRRTSLERFAYLYLQPRPGTDLALFNAMLKVIVEERLYDEVFVSSRCEGFEELFAAVRALDLADVAEVTGVRVEDIVAAARVYASGGRDDRHPLPRSWIGTLVDPRARPGSTASCIVYGSGITQQRQAFATVQALANLAMACGHLGKPGGGLCPRVGPGNQQGTVDMGAWADLLPGYKSTQDVIARLFYSAQLGGKPAERPGMTMLEMVDAARSGKLKALYTIGVNPLRIAPDVSRVREALERLDLLIVEDLFPSDLTDIAHVVLPAASVAEKTGTYTNGERRVQLGAQAIEPIGESRPDWQIIADLAHRVATMDGDARGARFEYTSPDQIMEEVASVVPAYAGISYERLARGGLQWPCLSAGDAGTDVLFVEGFERGKGRLVVTRYERGEAQHAADYPLQLIAGCEIYHANTGELSRRAKANRKFRPEPRLEINPIDAGKLGLTEGSRARITSATGRVEATVVVNDALSQGHVFLPMHYADAPANALFAWPDEADLRQPSLKTVAVRVVNLTR